MRRHVCAVLATLVFAVFTTWAGDGWVDKDWKQWSKDEVKVVLHDSPWSKGWAKGQVNTSAAVPGCFGSRAGRCGRRKRANDSITTFRFDRQRRYARR